MPFHQHGLCGGVVWWCVFAQASLLLGWWMTLAYPPLLWFAPCRGPTGSPHLPSTNAFVRLLLSSPLVTPLHLDISFPSRISLIFPSPPHHRAASQRGGFRSLPLLPPARSFYFSFIFPTREPSRCNLHPSCCCCCRRPSRLPRATIGVEACDSPGKIVVSGKKILLISIETANNWYESIFYYIEARRKEVATRSLQIPPTNGHYYTEKIVFLT